MPPVPWKLWKETQGFYKEKKESQQVLVPVGNSINVFFRASSKTISGSCPVGLLVHLACMLLLHFKYWLGCKSGQFAKNVPLVAVSDYGVLDTATV